MSTLSQGQRGPRCPPPSLLIPSLLWWRWVGGPSLPRGVGELQPDLHGNRFAGCLLGRRPLPAQPSSRSPFLGWKRAGSSSLPPGLLSTPALPASPASARPAVLTAPPPHLSPWGTRPHVASLAGLGFLCLFALSVPCAQTPFQLTRQGPCVPGPRAQVSPGPRPITGHREVAGLSHNGRQLGGSGRAGVRGTSPMPGGHVDSLSPQRPAAHQKLEIPNARWTSQCQNCGLKPTKTTLFGPTRHASDVGLL